MRKAEREVKDPAEKFAALMRCPYIVLAANGDLAPYQVPLNFGAALREEGLVLYFHCAKEGRKLELLRKDGEVSFCAANMLRVFNKGIAPCGYTTDYESVCGRGSAEILREEGERLEGLKADAQAVKPLLENGKEEFSMTIGGKAYTDRKEAGTALIAACAGLKAVKTSGQVGEFYGFQMSAEFDSFNQKYMLTLKRQCSYKIEVGKDTLGNLQRISNALSGIERKEAETQQKLETLQQQLETAKEEVAKPFEKEQELAEKSERLAELNALLNMDEKGPAEALGAEEVTEAADQPRNPMNYAGRVADETIVADSPCRPSVLGKLKEAQERIAAGQKKQEKIHRKLEPQL